jgi:hypothetical protein
MSRSDRTKVSIHETGERQQVRTGNGTSWGRGCNNCWLWRIASSRSCIVISSGTAGQRSASQIRGHRELASWRKYLRATHLSKKSTENKELTSAWPCLLDFMDKNEYGSQVGQIRYTTCQLPRQLCRSANVEPRNRKIFMSWRDHFFYPPASVLLSN